MSDEASGTGRKTSRRGVLRAVSVAFRGFAFAGVLAACGGDTAPPTPAAGTVKFINSGDSASQARMQGYIGDFQKSTGIGVSLMSIQSYYTQNIQAMVSAGVPPDALYVSRAEFDVLYPVKKLADLHGYLGNNAASAGAFFPTTLMEWQRENKQYVVPSGFRTVFVAFNNGLFGQNKLATPPSTWGASGWTITDFANAAMKITQPGSSAQDPDYGFYVDPTYPVWSTFIINAGGTVVNEQNRTVDVDQPPAIQAMTVMQNIIRAPGVMPPRDLVSADGGIDLFANGNLGMTITDPSTVDPRQNQSHFPWDVGIMPSGVGGRFTSGTGAGYGIVAGSKNADRAWKLVDFLTSANIQKQEAPFGQWIPSRPEVANSADFLPELDNVDLAPQHAKIYVDAISDNRVKLQPAINNWPDVLSALEAGIQGLWTGALTPDAAAAQMKKLAEPLLKSG